MTLKSYNDIKVETIWSSPNPGICIREALDNTMENISSYFGGPLETVSTNVLRFLFKAEHSSVVEHAVISFRVLGASRSWLAQITRHRMSSFTSSSQHYQDYTDYDNIIHPDLVDNLDFLIVFEYLNQMYQRKTSRNRPTNGVYGKAKTRCGCCVIETKIETKIKT